MRRHSKDSEDLQSQKSQNFNISMIDDNYARSFAVGNMKKFVNVTLPNIQIKGKQYYKKQPYCTICFRNFTTTHRQHHCRICVNAVCNECSRSMINKERACDVCVLRFTNIHQEKKKKQMLETLETLCAYLIYQKNQKLSELEKLKSSTNQQQLQNQLFAQQQAIKQLQTQNQSMRNQYSELEEQLNKVRQNNSEIQSKISEIEKEMEGQEVDLQNMSE